MWAYITASYNLLHRSIQSPLLLRTLSVRMFWSKTESPSPVPHVEPQVSPTLPEIDVGTTIDTATVGHWNKTTRVSLKNAAHPDDYTRFVCATPVVTCDVDEYNSTPRYCITASLRVTDLSDPRPAYLTQRGKKATEEFWIKTLILTKHAECADLQPGEGTTAKSSRMAREFSAEFCRPEHSRKLERGGVTLSRSEHCHPDNHRELLESREGNNVDRTGRLVKYEFTWRSDVPEDQNTQLSEDQNQAFK